MKCIIVFLVHMLCLKVERKSIYASNWIIVKLKSFLKENYFSDLYI